MFELGKNKKAIYLLLSTCYFLLLASSAEAICPICTVAVGAGVGFSRYLGVDDTITGLWIGGLTVSMIFWTLEYLKKKQWNFKNKDWVVSVGYLAIIIAPLYYTEIIGHPLNKILGVDKLVLGIAVGAGLFFLGAKTHFHHKGKNGDKVYFPFQKVVFSVTPLILASAVFYFLTK